MRDLVTAWVSPLGTALFLWALSLLWSGWAVSRKHHSAGAVKASTKGPRLLGGLGLAWLLLWSNPIASDALRGAIENTAGPRLVSELPTVQVAVVLGGGVSGPRPPQRPDPDLGSAADRLWHAARLYHEGKAQTLLLSGGTTRTGDGSEAQAMRRFLLDLGVPHEALWLEGASVNTTSNASHTAQLLRQQNIQHVLLVTSALHMPRARAALEATGLKVYPAPTDFEVIPMPMALHRLLPDAQALQGSARAMKELVGRWSGN
jgi:uncharacterized SAM-binding protein YcdF (DUF218 family)